ncbi:MAG: ATPase, T2SS/T4P/T4SS family [Chloroflexota bacterium]|nr:MAG: hypothetical protein DIU68_04535 [Chloroflexota bacterium]
MDEAKRNAGKREPRAWRPRPDADRGREPELIPARSGTRQYSRAALVERIEAAFLEEFSPNSPPLSEAKTRADRLKLLRETVDYVLAVESIALGDDERAGLMRQVYSRLFGYGPLDALIVDERIMTIALEGATRIAVRRGHGELETLTPVFDDERHLRQILTRLLDHAGARLDDDQPAVETGLTVDGRPLAITVIGPPATFVLSADIRLHPRQPPDLNALVDNGMLPDDAAHFLASLVASPYGFIIVGEGETGKTTLLNALAARLPEADRIATVERAGELRLPVSAQRFIVRWPGSGETAVTFADCVRQALDANADCLLVDEVRAEEAEAIAPLLEEDAHVPRLFWSFRGVPDAKRLQAALGMLARRANPGAGEAPVHTLYRRLPFVVSLARIRGQLQLFSIGEWQPTPASDYPDYVLLYQYRDGAARPTEKQPRLPVALG